MSKTYTTLYGIAGDSGAQKYLSEVKRRSKRAEALFNKAAGDVRVQPDARLSPLADSGYVTTKGPGTKPRI